MALFKNLSSGAGNCGDIIPIIKFDALSGRLSTRNYVGGEYVNVDVTRTFKAVMDLENIETGYISFSTGGAPDFCVARATEKQPTQPSQDHKMGFRMLLKLSKDCGGDIREFASNARACLAGIEALYTAYEAAAADNPGKLPIVVLRDAVAIVSGEGARKTTNYSPVFEIVGWSARPLDLVYSPKARSGAVVAAGAPPATGSTRVEAPVSFNDSDDSFG